MASQEGIFEMALELGALFEHHQACLEVVPETILAMGPLVEYYVAFGGDLRAELALELGALFEHHEASLEVVSEPALELGALFEHHEAGGSGGGLGAGLGVGGSGMTSPGITGEVH